MRNCLKAVLALTLSFAVCISLWAQAPGSQPQQPGQSAPGQTTSMNPEQQAVLEGILASWETDAKSLQSLFVQFIIEETDPVFKKKVNLYGEAKVLKMPSGQYGLKLEIFDLDRNGKPDPTRVKQKFVCSGTWFYTFEYATKVITFKRMDNMRPDDGPFAFLFGMKATEAKRRFTMTIVQQDQHYSWIKVIPLADQDKRDFAIAQLGVVRYSNAISPKDFPLRIMWREPGNKEISWEFKSVMRNDPTKVNMMDFSVENEKKQGWQLREVPTQGTNQPAGNNQGKVIPTGGTVPPK